LTRRAVYDYDPGMDTPTIHPAIERAIAAAGNQAALARAIDVSREFVRQMRKREKPVPRRLALRIEEYTAGAVTRLELLYPDE